MIQCIKTFHGGLALCKRIDLPARACWKSQVASVATDLGCIIAKRHIQEQNIFGWEFRTSYHTWKRCMIRQQLCLMSTGLRMATSYTVFLSENSNNKVIRRRQPKLAEKDSEAEIKLQLEPEHNREQKMLLESSAVVATKGCEYNIQRGPPK